MATLFFDTSALVRRYFQPEAGANRVREVCDPARRNDLLVARIAPVEVASALHRRMRQGTLTRPGLTRRWRQFLADLANQYELIEATGRVYDAARDLIPKYPLRALDALQLASGLAAAQRGRPEAVQFWTADLQQAAAARREGLSVELVG